MRNEWKEFKPGRWVDEVDVRDFIMNNYTPYDGDDSFLQGPTADTTALWQQVLELSKKEREAGGVLDMDTKVVSTILSHGPGYLDKDKETIVGFQTDKPFKRALMPYGGIRMAKQACEDNGYHLDPEIEEFFTTHRKTHNAGVFDAYTPEMRACRNSHVITGLPDGYGRFFTTRGKTRPHHRRLPPCCPVRCGPSDRGQGIPEIHHPLRHAGRCHP